MDAGLVVLRRTASRRPTRSRRARAPDRARSHGRCRGRRCAASGRATSRPCGPGPRRRPAMPASGISMNTRPVEQIGSVASSASRSARECLVGRDQVLDARVPLGAARSVVVLGRVGHDAPSIARSIGLPNLGYAAGSPSTMSTRRSSASSSSREPVRAQVVRRRAVAVADPVEQRLHHRRRRAGREILEVDGVRMQRAQHVDDPAVAPLAAAVPRCARSRRRPRPRRRPPRRARARR